ncbi:membrane protein containing DUF1112 [Beggiatoa sp. PS]|nr:membrane protein containing DUF1112 [Beggiatoa sp. PS]
MKSPVLSNSTFEKLPLSLVKGMTFQGTVNKTLILLIILTISVAWVWLLIYIAPHEELVALLSMLIGTIGGFIVALIIIFKQEWAPILAPIYALLEGLAIGAISALFEAEFPGIVIQAVGLTFGILFILLFAYKLGYIEVTDKFMFGIVIITGAICLIYFVEIGLNLFANASIPLIHESGPIGIGFSLFIVFIASMHLLVDFELIKRGVESEAPKYMEWYSAFAVIVTLVWLYLEILQLLAKMRGGSK